MMMLDDERTCCRGVPIGLSFNCVREKCFKVSVMSCDEERRPASRGSNHVETFPPEIC
jgi:hypothetical protein